ALFGRRLQRSFHVSANRLGQPSQSGLEKPLTVRLAQRFALLLELANLPVEFAVVSFGLGPLARRNIGQRPILGGQPALRIERRGEGRQQPVIFALGNGLVLVVVALGASKRQAQQVVDHHLAGALQDAVQDVLRGQLLFIGVVGGAAQKAG